MLRASKSCVLLLLVYRALIGMFRPHRQQATISASYQYDMMISYCWAEKKICKALFERLKTNGYRVWFDEQNMHGNSVSAMADAIESSFCIIVCMSESYEKSNACHSEADYARVYGTPIVPIVVQSKYKARRWLGFIIGSDIYVDFTKHEFEKAYGLLDDEFKAKVLRKPTLQNASETDSALKISGDKRIPSVVDAMKKPDGENVQVLSDFEAKKVEEWASIDVISWCQAHNLLTFLHLLRDYDGASLLRLYHLSKTSADEHLYRLLQEDFQQISIDRQAKLTFVEFIRFQSELDRIFEKHQPKPVVDAKSARFCAVL